jgi:ribosomal 30S subunit maturation factor RimM
MTNRSSIPPFDGANTTFAITFDADWNDQFFVGAPGFPGTPIEITGVLDGTTVITGISSDAGIATGCLIVGVGIPNGTVVDELTGTTITMSEAATISAPDSTFYIFPPPLDLTGISFRCQLRTAIGAVSALIDLSTENGLMVNGGTSGLFGFQVPAATLRASTLLNVVRQAGGQVDFVGDIKAFDTLGSTNLCPAAPFTVQVRQGITQ